MRSMAPRIKRSFSPSGAAFLQTQPKKTQPQTPAFFSVWMMWVMLAGSGGSRVPG